MKSLFNKIIENKDFKVGAVLPTLKVDKVNISGKNIFLYKVSIDDNMPESIISTIIKNDAEVRKVFELDNGSFPFDKLLDLASINIINKMIEEDSFKNVDLNIYDKKELKEFALASSINKKIKENITEGEMIDYISDYNKILNDNDILEYCGLSSRFNYVSCIGRILGNSNSNDQNVCSKTVKDLRKIDSNFNAIPNCIDCKNCIGSALKVLGLNNNEDQ